MLSIWHDIRYGMRTLVKSPAFTLVGVLTLALGIGANTAIFSVVRAVLLRPLPFKDPGRLVLVQESDRKGVGNPVAYPNYMDWRAQNHVFEQMAAYSDSEFIIRSTDKSEQINGELCTDTYFPLLGIAAVKGRTFLPEENQTPLRNAVAVIGFGLWQRRFGSDPNIVGRQIRINDSSYTIVGVAPRGFLGFSDAAEIWIPMMMHDAAWPQVAQYDFLHNRDIHWHKVLACLKPAVSLAAAQAEMEAIGARLSQAFPKENGERGVLLRPAQELYVSGFRAPLLILLGAVGLVLLIGCGNVANLMLARSASRQHELAVRVALGASRRRLIRQFLTETMLLAGAGAAAGILLAFLGLNALVSLLPVSLPSFAKIRLDGAVLVFTVLLSLGTAVLLSIVPAMGANRANLTESLKEGAKGAGNRGSRRIGAALIVSEVSLALVLMVGAGLLLKSFARMLNVNPGFRADHLVTLRFHVPDSVPAGQARDRFGPELAQRISAAPGVESAAVTILDPFVWGGIQRGFTIEGHAPLTNAEADTIYDQEIGPNYFHTMGIPIEKGRDFSDHDSLDAPRVIIVSDSFARRYWPGQNPIGKRLRYGGADSTQPWMEVIGVASDIKYNSIRQDPTAEPIVYAPLLQSEVIVEMSLVARTRTAPEAMINTLSNEIGRIHPDVTVFNAASVEQRLRSGSAETRSYAFLLGLFAALALCLSCVGIYGVIGYWVTRATREMGIRMALGATPGEVMRLFLRQGAGLTAIGLVAGVAASLALTRLMGAMLFGVSARDPLTFTGVAAILLVVALAACYFPARRAMRVDPIIALRYE